MPEENKQQKTQEQLLHDIEDMLHRNEEILVRVKRYLFWAQLLGTLKIVLILVPLIAAVYFLPSFIEQFGTLYKNSGLLPNANVNLLNGLDQYRNILQGQDVVQ